jgi:cell division transport system permease protein
MLMVGLALYIPAVLYMAADAGERYSRQIQAQVKMRAYLDDDQTPLGPVRQEIDTLAAVDSTHVLLQQDLLAELEAELGQGLLAGLPENPLPNAIEITIRPGHTSDSALEALAGVIQTLPGVDEVVYGRQWAQKAHAFFSQVRWFLVVVTVGLSLLVLAVAANTIRLIIRTRREAIGVWLLLGATPVYARMPYYIEGAISGLGGAVFALGLSYVTFAWVRNHVPTLEYFTLAEMVTFLIVAVLMALVGAVSAARRRIVPL